MPILDMPILNIFMPVIYTSRSDIPNPGPPVPYMLAHNDFLSNTSLAVIIFSLAKIAMRG